MCENNMHSEPDSMELPYKLSIQDFKKKSLGAKTVFAKKKIDFFLASTWQMVAQDSGRGVEGRLICEKSD